MSKYVSEDDAPIVETPIESGEGEVITAVSGTEPDMPAQDHDEAIADVTSTRDGDIAPADAPAPEQRFRFRQEEGEVAEVPAAPAEVPAEAPVAPAEAPAAPMDAPAAMPAADGVPAEAPAAPAEAPIADVPAAAPMVAPQPEADVAPMVPQEGGEVPAATPVAPEVEAPTAPAEAPVENAPSACGKKGFRQEDGEPMHVTDTEPRMPAEAENEVCPETGEEYETKNVNEPINPVIEQDDELSDDSNLESPDETEPVETEKTNDETVLDPEFAEDQEAAEAEVEQLFRMGYRMEDEAEISTDSEGGQDVDINVQVRKDDGDAHEADETEVEEAPEQRFRQEGDEIETVADVVDAPSTEPVPDDVVDDVVPTPDPNAGNPDPDQSFNSFMMDGGDWM